MEWLWFVLLFWMLDIIDGWTACIIVMFVLIINEPVPT